MTVRPGAWDRRCSTASAASRDLLEVVQDEEELAVAEVLLQTREYGLARVPGGPDSDGDLGRNDRRIRYRREVDKPHAVVERRKLTISHLQRQPGLAGAPGPGEGEEAGAFQRILHLPHGLLATDEAAHLGGEVVGAGVKRSQGRELGEEPDDRELVQALGVRHVLEAMVAEVNELRALGEGVLNQLLRGPRQQDLSPVSGVPDPGRAMDVEADVSLADRGALTGVQPHPDPDVGASRPGVAGQLPLHVDGRPNGRDRRGEHGEEGVALGIDDLATLPRQHPANDAAMLREERGVPVS